MSLVFNQLTVYVRCLFLMKTHIKSAVCWILVYGFNLMPDSCRMSYHYIQVIKTDSNVWRKKCKNMLMNLFIVHL